MREELIKEIEMAVENRDDMVVNCVIRDGNGMVFSGKPTDCECYEDLIVIQFGNNTFNFDPEDVIKDHGAYIIKGNSSLISIEF